MAKKKTKNLDTEPQPKTAAIQYDMNHVQGVAYCFAEPVRTPLLASARMLIDLLPSTERYSIAVTTLGHVAEAAHDLLEKTTTASAEALVIHARLLAKASDGAFTAPCEWSEMLPEERLAIALFADVVRLMNDHHHTYIVADQAFDTVQDKKQARPAPIERSRIANTYKRFPDGLSAAGRRFLVDRP